VLFSLAQQLQGHSWRQTHANLACTNQWTIRVRYSYLYQEDSERRRSIAERCQVGGSGEDRYRHGSARSRGLGAPRCHERFRALRGSEPQAREVRRRRERGARADASGTYSGSRRCGRLVRDRRLHGRGIGWVDAHLLGSALVGRLKLWTADSRLDSVAPELRVAYN
jgi:hypothetical protein